MATKQIASYTYNSTSIIKNSRKVDLDIDLICDDLYKSVPDKDKFAEIMQNIQDEIFSEDKIQKNQLANMSSGSSSAYNNTGGSYSNNQYNNPYSSTSGMPNVIRFKSTVPDGEMITPGPYQERIPHKKYTDVNANSNYYYPKNDTNYPDTSKSQWTNRANRILFDTQSNRGLSPRSSQNNSYYNSNPVMMSNALNKSNY